MDIVDRLEFKHLLYPDNLLSESADAIISERLISDKLYRALRLAIGMGPQDNHPVVNEALNSYEMARLPRDNT